MATATAPAIPSAAVPAAAIPAAAVPAATVSAPTISAAAVPTAAVPAAAVSAAGLLPAAAVAASSASERSARVERDASALHHGRTLRRRHGHLARCAVQDRQPRWRDRFPAGARRSGTCWNLFLGRSGG